MAASTRPLTLGEILDRTVQVYRRNFLLMVGIAAPAAGLVVLISGAVVLFFSSQFLSIANAQQTGKPAATPDISQQSLLMGLIIMLFLLIGFPLLLGVFAMALAALNRAAAEVLEGRAITIRASYGYAFRHFWRHVGILFQQSLFAGIIPYFVFVAVFLVGAILGALAAKSGTGAVVSPLLAIALILLVIALFVVCVLIWLRLSLAYPVCVVEDINAWSSLKRSNLLSSGTRGRIFVMFLLVGVLTIVVTLMLSMPIDIVIGLFMRKSITSHGLPTMFFMLIQIANLASGFLVRMFVMPIYSTALMLFYNDQRTRMEGYDIEQLMDHAGWSALPPAPLIFAPAPTTPETAPPSFAISEPSAAPGESFSSPVVDPPTPASEGSGA
jgi:MFS family permease